MATYKRIRVIGQGGFGTVEEVQDERGDSFARKTFTPIASPDPDLNDRLRKRFKREVTVQEDLGGHEILPVLDANLTGEFPWFVMPLADKTFETQIAEDRASKSFNVNAFADILNALQFVHDLGYVHRDLKPENILLHEGNWKLADLGAVLPPLGKTVTLTEGTTIFTEDYCSPEQHADFHNAQSFADVYSFGCILHDMFGVPPRTPYAQHTVPEIYEISIIVEKCTEFAPGKRPSVDTLRDVLLETLIDLQGHPKTDDPSSQDWLARLEHIDDWTDIDFEEFVRFIASSNPHAKLTDERWLSTYSTPFLTRINADTLKKVAVRKDGLSSAIIQKYTDWVRNSIFLFAFADIVSGRVTAIFDNGSPANKAVAFVSLIILGESHNRWHVMREMFARCRNDVPNDIARRLSIEIRTEEVEAQFRRCINELKIERESLHPEFGRYFD